MTRRRPSFPRIHKNEFSEKGSSSNKTAGKAEGGEDVENHHCWNSRDFGIIAVCGLKSNFHRAPDEFGIRMGVRSLQHDGFGDRYSSRQYGRLQIFSGLKKIKCRKGEGREQNVLPLLQR